MNVFGHLVGLLGRGISPTQGLYLYRTTQHRKTRTHIQAPSGIRAYDPSVRDIRNSHHTIHMLTNWYVILTYGGDASPIQMPLRTILTTFPYFFHSNIINLDEKPIGGQIYGRFPFETCYCFTSA